MIGVENLAIFISAATSTLLGFVAVVFFFWAGLEGRWAKDKLKQNKNKVIYFKRIVATTIILIFYCFVTIYNSIVDPNGEWQTIFLVTLTIGFLSYIIMISYFFIGLVENMLGENK